MKSIRSTILLAGMFISLQWLDAQTVAIPDQTGVPAPTAYQIVESGANHNVWQRQTYEKLANGTIVSHLHKLTELASGLNYQTAQGEWVRSQENITPYATGAIAQEGEYQAHHF